MKNKSEEEHHSKNLIPVLVCIIVFLVLFSLKQYDNAHNHEISNSLNGSCEVKE